MKKIFAIISAAAVVLLCASCGKDDKTESAQATLQVLSGAGETIPAGGGSIRIEFDAPDELLAWSRRPWLSATVDGNAVVLEAGSNDSIESRYSELTVYSGDLECTLTIQQMGKSTKYVEDPRIVPTVSVAEDYTVSISVKADSEAGDYFIAAVSRDQVTASGAGDDVSLFLSLNSKAEMLRSGKTLYSGDRDMSLGVYERGLYYLFIIGWDGESPSYTYACEPFGILYTYDRWIGTWSATDAAGGSSIWKVTGKTKDADFIVTGIGGSDYPVKATFDSASGNLVIASQNGLGETTMEGETFNVVLLPVTDGYYTNKIGETLMTAVLGDDKVSATVTGNSSYTGFAFFYFQGSTPYAWEGEKAFPVKMSRAD